MYMIAGNMRESMEAQMNEMQKLHIKLLLKKLSLNNNNESLSLLRCNLALMRWNLGCM